MMKNIKNIIAISAVLITGFANALSSPIPGNISGGEYGGMSEVRNWMDKIDSITTIPVSGLSLIEADGKTFLVSKNAHYAIVGDYKLIDVWNSINIKTPADVKKSKMVPVTVFKEAKKSFATVTYGNGPSDVYIFTDPDCKFCGRLLKQTTDISDKYTFNFVLYPATNTSIALAKKVACADNNIAARALVTGDFSKIPNNTNCKDVDFKLKNASAIGAVLGVERLPYSIAPNRIPFQGYLRDFSKWLERNNND